jgi:hypothetical protein
MIWCCGKYDTEQKCVKGEFLEKKLAVPQTSPGGTEVAPEIMNWLRTTKISWTRLTDLQLIDKQDLSLISTIVMLYD